MITSKIVQTHGISQQIPMITSTNIPHVTQESLLNSTENKEYTSYNSNLIINNCSYVNVIKYIFNICISIIAIYLFVQCNKDNKSISYVLYLFSALCYPYIYIICSLIYNSGICKI
jgi:uncharacterized protein YggT (Ycf19 family)